MPITSQQQFYDALVRLELSLTHDEIISIVERLKIGKSGVIAGFPTHLIMEKCSGKQLKQLMNSLQIRITIGPLGGDIYLDDHRPTGDLENPCVMEDGETCWLGRVDERY